MKDVRAKRKGRIMQPQGLTRPTLLAGTTLDNERSQEKGRMVVIAIPFCPDASVLDLVSPDLSQKSVTVAEIAQIITKKVVLAIPYSPDKVIASSAASNSRKQQRPGPSNSGRNNFAIIQIVSNVP